MLLYGVLTLGSVPIALAASPGDGLAPVSGDALARQGGGPVLHQTRTYLIYWKQVDLSTWGQTFYYEAPRCYAVDCLHSYATDSNYENRSGNFLRDVGGSPWYGILTQYWDQNATGQQVPVFNESTLAGTWKDNSGYPNLGRGVPATSLSTSDIQAEIARAIQTNGWTPTADNIYFVYLPEEVQACDGQTGCH